jgi:Ras-related protein Rab-11A
MMSIADDQDEFDCLFKIVLIGKSFVGKSKILLRYLRGEFTPESKTTLGVEFATKILAIDTSKIKVQIWDTFGNEKFRSLSKVYFRGAVGAILAYDITSEDSFLELPEWLSILEENISKNDIVLMLAGNKCDLEEERQVKLEQGMEFAEKNGMGFYETSAKDGKNVDHMFRKLIEEIYKQMIKACLYKSTPQHKQSVLAPPEPRPRKKSCDC